MSHPPPTPSSASSSRHGRWLVLALMAGCAMPGSLPTATAAARACPADTGGCQGSIMTMPPTFERVDDPAVIGSLLNPHVLAAPGKGGLCVAEVWRALSPVTVYRLQDSGADGKLGYWWTFAPPQGTAAGYRRDYVICPEWNRFTEIVVCQLKVGSLVAVGPGQSATCKAADGAEWCLPASASNQVNTDWKANLEGCVTAPYSFR